MTLKVFKDLNEYYKYLEFKTIAVLEEIGNETLDELKLKLKSRLYDFAPKMYIRTGELMESLTCTKVFKDNGFLCIKIFYDTDKIISYSSLSNLQGEWTYGSVWGQHTDIYGNDVSNYIPLWIEEGTSANNGNFFPRKGVNSISEEVEWLRNNFTKLFKEKLKKRGIFTN